MAAKACRRTELPRPVGSQTGPSTQAQNTHWELSTTQAENTLWEHTAAKACRRTGMPRLVGNHGGPNPHAGNTPREQTFGTHRRTRREHTLGTQGNQACRPHAMSENTSWEHRPAKAWRRPKTGATHKLRTHLGNARPPRLVANENAPNSQAENTPWEHSNTQAEKRPWDHRAAKACKRPKQAQHIS